MPHARAPRLLLGALLLCCGPGALADEGALLEGGRRDYAVHCASCHGREGRGDGPLVEALSTRPNDLRRIPRRPDGSFPFERLVRVIDGREIVKGHGLREMPVWGLSFAERGLDAPQEAHVRARIVRLVQYLRSIQLDRSD
jgi:hypothetical protein